MSATDPTDGPRVDTAATVPQSLGQLHEAVARMLDEPAGEVGLDDDLILDWGLDSMRILHFVTELQAAGIEVSGVELAEQPSVTAWAALIATAAAGSRVS